MLTKDQAIEIMQQVFDNLCISGVVEEDNVKITEDTFLLGKDSKLDSIAFVTFITDLEDRASVIVNKEVNLIIDEIHEINKDQTALTVGTLASYLVKITL
jgi:acyl carrier protein